MLKPFAKGTLVADGSEQVVMEISGSARVSGYISLANMEAGDTVVIRQLSFVRGRCESLRQKFKIETSYFIV